jgi:hypothetical protein
MRISSLSSIQLIEMISNLSGSSSNGVVGIPLQLLLNFDERSVADFYLIARVSPKSFKSQLYTVTNILTVNTHVRSIYSKLGVTSRSATTRYAMPHKLV